MENNQHFANVHQFYPNFAGEKQKECADSTIYNTDRMCYSEKHKTNGNKGDRKL
jgi:hypothetical protein